MENKRMKTFIFFFTFLLYSNVLASVSWNQYLHLVSGPKECPAGELKYEQLNKKITFADKIFDFSIAQKEFASGTIPTCHLIERVIFKPQENQIEKESKVTKCIDPTDDFHLSEILTLNLSKKTALFQYVKTKTKSIKQKIKCRYKFRR